ncbi:transcriptional regulator, AsnC family [Methylomagnum ishizawai]|uniref:siroheme decarboxylase n=1 Tax=Methylomagnum ishizawai TaxID=1760988 RepID=A0A1Y6CW49_9GAMM|nr:Lrp/AsnC family transcriptional regulator [Methylomagnum ishizawai]SMF94567.1 transcriptional regulator, AsnC family [Methylomagnum ishizawai]
MNALERTLINDLQGGFPICERPYLAVAERLGLTEEAVIEGLRGLLDQGILSRFGPLYHAERMGGALSLAALAVPEADYERVVAEVNAFPEVAHNYARDHALNMWFVLATEKPERKAEVIAGIEATTGLKVHDMPKLAEYYVGLRLEV